MASFRAPQPAVPAASTSSLSTGHSQTNIANTFDIEPALKHTQLHQIGIGLLRASKNKIPKDPSFHEAFARDMERIFDPTRLNPDDQTGNGLSQMNLDDEFWSDPAQWHPDDQIGEGLTERRSHNHEGLTQDILMNEDQNEQPVIGWNAKAGAFSGLGVSWDMLVSGPREAADVGTKPARRNKNAEASTSASSSPLRCVQEQGVSKAPSKARTAERPIFGTGSDNPAHRYICETCRKEGYAKCRFRRQDSLDRHQARHIGIYESECPYCNKGISREDNAFDHFRHAHRKHFQRDDCDRSQHNHHTRENQRICLACPKCGENWKQTRKERKGMRKDPSITDLGRHLIDTESKCYGSLKNLF